MAGIPSWFDRDVAAYAAITGGAWLLAWFVHFLQCVGCVVACVLLGWLWPHAVIVDAVASRANFSPWAKSLLCRWRVCAATVWASLALLCVVCPGWTCAAADLLAWSPILIAKAIVSGAIEVARGILALGALLLHGWSSSTALVYYSLIVGVAWIAGRTGLV